VNETNHTRSNRILWILVGLGSIGIVVTAGTCLLAWRMAHRRPEIGRSVETAPIQTVVSDPIPLAHEVTSAESRRWQADVPHGTQVLNGVTFVCDGAVRTAGLRGRKYPGAVLGIPIHRRGTMIHLLQSAENMPGNPIGSVYGRLRFHFGNGESRDTYLRFGVHGRDWFQLRRQLDQGVSDPNTEVAWVAQKQDKNVFVRLFHTALENPFPKEKITTVDAISPLGEGNLLLFAVSIDTSAVKLKPAAEDESVIEMLAFEFALSSDGKPVSSGSVEWMMFFGNRSRIVFPRFPCDASGRVNIDFPTRAISELRYTATDASGATTNGRVMKPETGWSPTQQVAIIFPNK
jgi:hypothetical protein